MLIQRYHKNGLEAGLDEAGRGCLAGPVAAAAVILNGKRVITGLDDSKKLSQQAREALRMEIEAKADYFSVAFVAVAAIDQLNILHASIHAMHQALRKLKQRPDHLLVDGNRFHPYQDIPHTCIVGGDGRYASIAAASILAKTYRDAYMVKLHEQYPEYDWASNKGYPTEKHRRALTLYGRTAHHRKTFKYKRAQTDSKL